MAQHPGPKLGHRPALDGLRGVAVAAVVAYHLGFLSGGFLGVDVFFVLSGYLITSLVLVETDGSGRLDVRAFWGRRIRRLVPALAAMVGVVLVAAQLVGWPRSQLRTLGIDGLATLTWWANWRQASGPSYWDLGADPFRHAWSLAIEEQFYVLWPLLVVAALAVARRAAWSTRVAIGAVAGVGALASSGWMVVLSRGLDDGDLSRAYVGTDARVAAPLLGCVLACWLHGRSQVPTRPLVRRAMGAASLVAVVVLVAMAVGADVVEPALYRSGGFAAAAVAASALVWRASLVVPGERSAAALVLANPAVTYLGRRSYALYLWSWPIQVLVAFRLPDLGAWSLAGVTVALSLVLAEASHHLLEHPLRRSTGWAAAGRLRRPAWAAVVLVPVLALVATGLRSDPAPSRDLASPEESAVEALRPPPGASTEAVDAPEADVEPSAELEPQRVLVLGDSVAWTVGRHAPEGSDLPAGIASIDGRGLIGCGLLAGEGWKYRARAVEGPFTAPPGDSCTVQREAEDLGLAGAPDVVFVVVGAWEWIDARAPDGEIVEARSPQMAEVLEARLVDRIERAHAVGARVLLVEWVCPGSQVSDGRADPGYVAWFNGVLADAVASARAADERIDARVLGPNEEVCEGGDATGAPTPARADATGDEVHIADAAGGRWIWHAWFGPALR